MKRKVIFTSLVLLCMMLIVGVGFSVWSIKNDPVKETSPGNIIAYGVIENGVLQVDIVDSGGNVPSNSDPEYGYYNKVVFGKPNPLVDGIANTPPWLISNDIGDEHLDIYIKVTVTYPGIFKIEDSILDTSDGNSPLSTLLFGGPNISIATDNMSQQMISGCSASLIPATESDPLKLNISALSGSSGSVVLKVSYTWPDIFEVTKNGDNYYNPYYYFNSHGKNDPIGSIYTSANQKIGTGSSLTTDSTYAQFAVAYLSKLNELSSHIAFKITFTEVTS